MLLRAHIYKFPVVSVCFFFLAMSPQPTSYGNKSVINFCKTHLLIEFQGVVYISALRSSVAKVGHCDLSLPKCKTIIGTDRLKMLDLTKSCISQYI